MIYMIKYSWCVCRCNKILTCCEKNEKNRTLVSIQDKESRRAKSDRHYIHMCKTNLNNTTGVIWCNYMCKTILM